MCDFNYFVTYYDIINVIASKISFVTLWSLTIAYPPLKKIINAKYFDINLIIKNKLKLFIDETLIDEFIRLLKTSENYIFGSFLLQCLYDVEWVNSDLDICCLYTENPPDYIRYRNSVKIN